MFCSFLCVFVVFHAQNKKNWLDLSAHFVPGFVCRLKLDTCSHQRWNRNILQWKELLIPGDLPSPLGSQSFVQMKAGDGGVAGLSSEWDFSDLTGNANKYRIQFIYLWNFRVKGIVLQVSSASVSMTIRSRFTWSSGFIWLKPNDISTTEWVILQWEHGGTI